MFRGAEFRPVRRRSEKRKLPSEVAWYQPVMTEPLLQIVPPTRAGLDPFDDDPEGRYRCPRGHVLGLSRLSELWISVGRSEVPDIAYTRQYFGIRRGVLRPRQSLIISQRLWQMICENKMKGFRAEVAHTV